ncbi:hypothetical protein AVEN_213410-1 [Araneus ventricosus]|uniref:Uncharacterized protein n=1 Tax=Araneus ventricosus TaxID=182803 RepID=A0A4Y2QGE1_ARAVE|nr:hypothetical protein AVEN_213410-1 [Araneus ventricosus]
MSLSVVTKAMPRSSGDRDKQLLPYSADHMVTQRERCDTIHLLLINQKTRHKFCCNSVHYMTIPKHLNDDLFESKYALPGRDDRLLTWKGKLKFLDSLW